MSDQEIFIDQLVVQFKARILFIINLNNLNKFNGIYASHLNFFFFDIFLL